MSRELSHNVPEDIKIDKACAMTASSMRNTASYVEIFRGTEETRLANLSFLFRKNYLMMRDKSPESMHYTFDEYGVLDCFFMLVPNDAAHFSFCEKVSGGLPEIPFYCGYFCMQRLLKASDYADSTEQALMAEYPRYLVLQRMVVTPAKQGKGLGSKCLNKALIEVADQQQLPVILGTQDPRNVIFYGRL